MIVTVTPNPSLDRTLALDRLRLGDVNRARQSWVEPSGKGVNVARALHRGGHRTLAVLVSGGDVGTGLVRALEGEGVPVRPVPIAEPVRVNVTVIDDSGPAGSVVVTKINEPGPGVSAAEVEELLAAAADASRQARWVVASGSLPRGADPAFYARLGERVRAAGARFALDSSGVALAHGLGAAPDLVMLNLAELTELVGRPLSVLGEVSTAAEEVRARTKGAVLVGLGEHGCVLLDDGPAVHGRPGPVAVRNPTGGGDSLLAGYLAARPRHAAAERVSEALAWASAAVRSPTSVGDPPTHADRAGVHIAPVDPAYRL